jgi:hypothetical protein
VLFRDGNGVIDEKVSMSVGKIAEFNIETDNWRLYVDRLEQYFVVNKVDKDMYVPTLITVMFAECYELLVKDHGHFSMESGPYPQYL